MVFMARMVAGAFAPAIGGLLIKDSHDGSKQRQFVCSTNICETDRVVTLVWVLKGSTKRWVKWCPIQGRFFYSNESYQLAPILPLLPLFFWRKERGKIDHSHLNETLSFE